MKKVIQTISFSIFFMMLSLNLVKADLVTGPGPVEYTLILVPVAIAIAIIALIAWLIIRKIKKNNASKSNK